MIQFFVNAQVPSARAVGPRRLSNIELVYVGENLDSYGVCEGDCDHDGDCEVGTKVADM